MQMPEMLHPDGRMVTLGGVEILARGLSGRVDVHLAGTGTMRSAEDTQARLLDALEGTDYFEQLTVEIAAPVEHAAWSPPGKRGPAGELLEGTELVVTVPGPGDGYGQVMLACDEDGVLTWHFPEDVPPTEVLTRAVERRTYRLRGHVMEDALPGKRGLMGALGKKLLKVLAFKLLDKALGVVGDFFVSRWEEKNRPHWLRSFTPQDYNSPAGTRLESGDLDTLGAGPALLFIHGTASQGHKAFGALPAGYLQELHRRYQGRVFGFEHPTLSITPEGNVRWLAGELSRLMSLGQVLHLDVVAHSRGGLVGRVMCEQALQTGLEPWVQIRNLIMVATPNAGTPLADRTHLHSFIETLTNLLEFIPDNPATDTLDVLLTLLKQVAVGAMGGLDGLMSMDPGGVFLRGLNRPSTVAASYHALAANFEPPQGSSLGRYARDHLTDLVFCLEPNDLVVPTEGVYRPNGATAFPIQDRHVFKSDAGVDHSSFWTQQPTLDAFDRWLTG